MKNLNNMMLMQNELKTEIQSRKRGVKNQQVIQKIQKEKRKSMVPLMAGVEAKVKVKAGNAEEKDQNLDHKALI